MQRFQLLSSLFVRIAVPMAIQSSAAAKVQFLAAAIVGVGFKVHALCLPAQGI